jgi:arsenite methyltransferase
MSDVKEAVRSRYAGVARQLAVLQPDPSAGCCQADGPGCGCTGSYSADELKEIGLTESVSLGCGNPTMIAQLEPGQVVLDLGSGAGLDVLLSARRVAPGGHAYGLDMTDEMLQLANDHKAKAGVANATFLKGSIDNVPLPDASVDVVISNCVINLAEDKAAVIKEAFRVLRSGGLFAVADMVELEALDPDLKQRLDAWAGCISGTIPIDEYRAALVAAGFGEPDFQVHATETTPGIDGKVGSAYIRARKPPREEGVLGGARTGRGFRPRTACVADWMLDYCQHTRRYEPRCADNSTRAGHLPNLDRRA